MTNNKNITLLIDTSNNKEIKVGLDIDGEKKILKHPIDRKTQAVLPLLDTLLKKNKLDIRDMSRITVNAGPGSFTGLRVGIAIANTLSFLLAIPINGKKIGEIVEPTYL